MPLKPIQNLACLRLAVGALGERSDPPWWRSLFCGQTAETFLSPVFPRTVLLSRYNGVVAAARLVHDEHIGVGRVFHLFRLPDDVEESISRALQDEAVRVAAESVLSDSEGATGFLRSYASSAAPAVGPVSAGSSKMLRRESSWKEVCARYLAAFEANERVYPYFESV